MGNHAAEGVGKVNITLQVTNVDRNLTSSSAKRKERGLLRRFRLDDARVSAFRIASRWLKVVFADKVAALVGAGTVTMWVLS